ncbi:MAG: phosphoribosyltransferase [Deltaproteobacteria bacterium]|nr:phosphoribosyltransferase [Deltaproteobacteria bacterium]
MSMRMFKDRSEAGARLAEVLGSYSNREEALVLGLPRGGVVVAYEIARALGLQLDVLIVRKLGFPGQPEFGIGAVSETDRVVLNSDVIGRFGVPPSYLEGEIGAQRQEMRRRAHLYRGDRALPALKGRVMIVVDDGVATGSTMKAAIATLRKEELQKLVVAVPVAPPDTADELRALADEFYCLATPELFRAVGAFYWNFEQVSDAEVTRLLNEAGTWRSSHGKAA